MNLLKTICGRIQLLVVALVATPVCLAQNVSIVEYPINVEMTSGYNYSILEGAVIAGNDGNFWVPYREESKASWTPPRNYVLRITPTGAATKFEVGIWLGNPITGPDGNVWVAGWGIDGKSQGVLARVTLDGQVTRFVLYEQPWVTNFDIFLRGITLGPDGNIWVAGLAQLSKNPSLWSPLLFRVTPKGEIADLSEKFSGLSQNWGLASMAIQAGPDGNLWVSAGQAIARITPAGESTLFTVPSEYGRVSDMSFRHDGNLWAMAQYAVLKIGLNGEITKLSSYPYGIWMSKAVEDPDGNLWYADNGIIRVTSSGEITVFTEGLPGYPNNTSIHKAVLGPDHELWFVNIGPKTIGHTVGVATLMPCSVQIGSLRCEDLGTKCPVGFSPPDCTQSIAPKNLGGFANACQTKPQAGNPIDVGTGNKYQVETDYPGGTAATLALTRTYNSSAIARNGLFGVSPWRSSFDRSVKLYQKNGKTTAAVQRPDGKIFYFDYATGQFSSTEDIDDRLTLAVDGDGQPNGFLFASVRTGDIESYDNEGRLVQITARSGMVQNLAYDTQSKLIQVTDSFGKVLSFDYGDQKRVSTITDPAGGVYKYAYGSNNNLISVTYPDAGVRQYLYENASLPQALTGITDENGKRFASWTYDAQGRAISSEHAGGGEKTTLTYGDNNTQVTDTLNSVRTYNFETILGVVKNKGQSQPGGSGCSAAASALTYDANGNIASQTDFNGNKVTYVYDLTRNLETKRVEADGTAQARVITTEWHPTYRLPTRIAEPKRITINTYDAKGNLLSTSVQASTDATGSQGLNATMVGTARTWTYTYNDVGQVLTATDPLGHATTYSYDSQGNLITVTNALGQVMTLSNYDANGRVGRLTDPNGLVTDLTYSPRGWLTSRTVGGETTSYDYDAVGQLTKVTLPDGAALSFTHDDAHRLTDITDSLGNSIHYTLDNMSNRIKEEVKDPSGALARQTTRVYDALNRLQQITGGMQ